MLQARSVLKLVSVSNHRRPTEEYNRLALGVKTQSIQWVRRNVPFQQKTQTSAMRFPPHTHSHPFLLSFSLIRGLAHSTHVQHLSLLLLQKTKWMGSRSDPSPRQMFLRGGSRQDKTLNEFPEGLPDSSSAGHAITHQGADTSGHEFGARQPLSLQNSCHQ